MQGRIDWGLVGRGRIGNGRGRIGIALAVVLVGGSALAAGTSSASVGTWTKITSPKGPGQPIYSLFDVGGATPTISVAGQASVDVTSVNIYCLSDNDREAQGPLNASAVSVSSGFFTATGLSLPETQCVLRAIPSTYTGISSGKNSGYVGAFAGPSYYLGVKEVELSGSTPAFGFFEAFEQRAIDVVESPSQLGVFFQILGSDFSKSDVDTTSAYEESSLLETGNLTSSGPSTRSAVVVDGHNAYLPGVAIGLEATSGTAPGVTFTAKRSSSGDVTSSDSEPLSWCDGNAYPQTSGSCTVRSTGVKLVRSVVTSEQGATISVRDRFVSSNGAAHSISVEYLNVLVNQSYGDAGVMLPGHSSFSIPSPDSTVTSLPAGPNTFYLASDVHAADNAPNRADTGYTYSGKPTLFFATGGEFALRYSRHIPAHGSAALGFGFESAFSIGTAKSLAKSEQKAFTEHLTITKPKSGAKVGKSVTVSGEITNPVNGLPTSVTVKSGSVDETATVSSTGKWSVKLTLKKGKHAIRATATDPSGHKLAAKVTAKVK
jgi:Glucodextranase, domain B